MPRVKMSFSLTLSCFMDPLTSCVLFRLVHYCLSQPQHTTKWSSSTLFHNVNYHMSRSNHGSPICLQTTSKIAVKDDGTAGISGLSALFCCTHPHEQQCKMPCPINASDRRGCDVAVKIQSHGCPPMKPRVLSRLYFFSQRGNHTQLLHSIWMAKEPTGTIAQRARWSI